MKKILLLTAILLSTFSINSYAAQYEDISTDNGHGPFGQVVQEITSQHLNNWNLDINALRNDLTSWILAAWGWNGDADIANQMHDRTARIEGDYLIVGCGNMDLWRIYIWGSTPSSSSPADSSSWWWGEPTPPAPVISSASSTSGESCSYIASWSENWSTCAITGWWNANGSINCQQNLSWIPNSATASWSCTTEITYSDGVEVWRSAPSCNGSCPASAPQPGWATETKTITMGLSTPTTQTNNAYANNSDTNKIQVLVSGATNQNRAIVWWWNAGKFSWFEDSSNLPSDLVAKTGKALAINHSQDVTSVNPNGVLVEIPVTSKTPFEWKWKISFQAWGVPFVLNNVQYSFKKPFVWILWVKDNSWTWNGTTTLWTTNDYKLTPFSKSTVNLATANYSLEDFTNKISVLWDDIEIQTKKVDTSTLNTAWGTLFNTRINTTASAKNLNQTPWLQIEPPVISYQLWGQSVKYYLSEGDGATDISPIKTAWSEFLWVRVIWGIQWTGKSEFTWQQANISNLYNSDQRTIIRKNAYDYVKNMKNWEIVWWVKYVLGDTTLAWEINYETLVVVDGNVTITDNVNNSKKKFWIIVLKDNYDVNKDIEWKGNIYIKPNVTQINAIIYSDGALISTDNSWKVYSEDSSTRTANLNKQLILNGSVFTRNTIGWAILAWGKYILPGWVKTDDFDQAMVFDLNYVRRWNVGCEKKNNTCVYTEPFIIKYDSRVQTSPPKLFSK